MYRGNNTLSNSSDIFGHPELSHTPLSHPPGVAGRRSQHVDEMKRCRDEEWESCIMKGSITGKLQGFICTSHPLSLSRYLELTF